MEENEMFVDNPLAITGLFNEGVFLVSDQQSRQFQYHGAGNLKILHIMDYDMPSIPEKAFQVLDKLMGAVKWQGKLLEPIDYAVINAANVLSVNKLAEIVDDFMPEKVIVWTDKWYAPDKEVLFYQNAQWGSIAVLRCHALHTVVSDADRKRECWSAIKRFFGM